MINRNNSAMCKLIAVTAGKVLAGTGVVVGWCWFLAWVLNYLNPVFHNYWYGVIFSQHFVDVPQVQWMDVLLLYTLLISPYSFLILWFLHQQKKALTNDSPDSE